MREHEKIKKEIINHFQICSLMINVIINAKKETGRDGGEGLGSEARAGTLLNLLLR